MNYVNVHRAYAGIFLPGLKVLTKHVTTYC